MSCSRLFVIALIHLVLAAFPLGSNAQDTSGFLDLFDKLSDDFEIIPSDPVAGSIPKSGHLQGIQATGNNVYVSGSSSEQGYLGVFKKDQNKLEFLGLKTLSEKPFTHAGGFQVAGNWLAIGCENPKAKTGSLILLQNIENGESISLPPAYTMERSGRKKVSTAGAVAIIARKDHFLLAVGTWDCATIDLYVSNHLNPARPDFEFTPWTTWEATRAVRKNWVEKKWIAYQNIQLIEDDTGVYLIALGKNKSSEQVTDVFVLDVQKSRYEMLTKVRHRVFELPPEASFRNGAGIVNGKHGLQLWAVGRNLKPKTTVAVFSSSTE